MFERLFPIIDGRQSALLRWVARWIRRWTYRPAHAMPVPDSVAIEVDLSIRFDPWLGMYV